MKRLACAGLALFSAAALAGSDARQVLEEGFGPLTVRSESPMQVLRLTPLPRAPILPPPGETRFKAMANVSSIWAQTPEYVIDMHLADVRLALSHGFAPGWVWEFALNERRTVNPHLDGLSLAFHDLLGIDQHGRDTVPRNDTRVSIPAYGLESSERGTFSRSVEATLTRRLHRGRGGLALSLSATVRHEILENGPLPQGGTDYAVQFSLAQKLSARGRLYADVAHLEFGEDSFRSLIPLDSRQNTAMLGYEWRRRDTEAVLVQYLYAEGVVKGLSELGKPSHELVFGYKWLRPSGLWEFAVTENIINFNNSPDIGFTLAFSTVF